LWGYNPWEEEVQRSYDRVLSSHIGSLPRVPGALRLLEARNRGEVVDDETFESTIKDAVAVTVRRQADAGLTVVNDGEQSKWAYMAYVRDRLNGFEVRSFPVAGDGGSGGLAAEAFDFPKYYEHWSYAAGSASLRTHACTGPISYRALAEVDRDISNLKEAGSGVEVADLFMTAISPAMVWSTPNEHYADEESYRHAICDALAVEYARIVAAGIVVQIDCPDLGIPPRTVPNLSLDSYRAILAKNIEGLNYATRDIDPDMLRIHVCYGADEAPHNRDPNLGDILDVLLTARPNGLTIVGANGRHDHEWRVWRDLTLPDGKVIMAGVIDSTTNIIEHPDLVADRIVRYVEALGQENFIAGVDCGLATISGVDQVDPDVAWAKLASLGEGARRATARLKPA
jgi:5-methyltetrahydropteroyltriglutamate--homocysteine methyltransferase